MSKLFRPGSTWRHKNTGLMVYIRAVQGSELTLGPCLADGPVRYYFQHSWTAMNFVEAFELIDGRIDAPNVWDRVLWDEHTAADHVT